MVATPSTVDCTIPHEFQGINTEVTVDESTTDRLSRRPSSPNWSYTPLNNRLERMIEIYWSDVVALNNTPAPTVVATADVVRCTKRKNSCVSESSMRLPVMTPPKHIAQRMRIGDEYGLTRERVRQIKEKALRGLRKSSRSEILKPYL